MFFLISHPQEAFTYVSSVYDNCFWCQRIIVVIIYPRGACVLNKKLLKIKYLSKFRLYWAIWIFREQRSTSVKLMYRDCKLYSFRYSNEIHYKHQFVKFNVIVGGPLFVQIDFIETNSAFDFNVILQLQRPFRDHWPGINSKLDISILY